MDHIILEIEFFSEVNDSMILELYSLGMSNDLLDQDDKPLTPSKNRYARVIEKGDRSLRQDIIDGAMAFLNKLNQGQKLSAILWERAFPGLPEKDLAPRKIESFGVLSHKIKRRELDTFLSYQFLSDNRLIIFGRESFSVYDLNKQKTIKEIKCSLPLKFIEIGDTGFLLKSGNKLLFSYDPKTFKKNPSSEKLKSHIKDVYQYDEQHLIIASDKNVYLYDYKMCTYDLIYSHDTTTIENICLSENNEFLLIYSPSRSSEFDTVIWNIKKKKIHLQTNWVSAYTFPATYIAKNSLVQNAFAKCTSNPGLTNQFYTLEIEDGSITKWIPEGYEIIGLSNTGKYTVVNNKNEVELRDMNTDEVLYKSETFVEEVIKVRFSDDDQRIGVVTTEHFFQFYL